MSFRRAYSSHDARGASHVRMRMWDGDRKARFQGTAILRQHLRSSEVEDHARSKAKRLRSASEQCAKALS